MRRFTSLEDERVLVSTDLGDYAVLSRPEAEALQRGVPPSDSERARDLEARGLLTPPTYGSDLEQAMLRTRKAFLLDGPALHIFVVSLRCDHSCQYCQVSRASLGASGYDMLREAAAAAVDRVFESPARALTIEFQGGEPALRFDLIREIVELARTRNEVEGRQLQFSMVSTLHHLGPEELAFCRDHQVHLSTSIDGSREIHDAQRPNPTRDSWQRTVDALGRARAIMGEHAIAALPTITRAALADPAGLIEQYRALGFPSIFLRPVSPYGFARKTRRALGYEMAEFIAFYRKALDYILALNVQGIPFEETYAAIMLRNILTPFHSGYVDLRSPAGAGLGVLVYNYDGKVYPSDEARMAAETGDSRFCMGSVHDTFDTLMGSEAMRWLRQGAVAEELPGCKDCAFVPFCGADPTYHAAAQGDPIGDRVTSEFCQKHLALFRILFGHIAEADPETMKTFLAWAMRSPREDMPAAGFVER